MIRKDDTDQAGNFVPTERRTDARVHCSPPCSTNVRAGDGEHGPGKKVVGRAETQWRALTVAAEKWEPAYMENSMAEML
ncbi:MAG: hypothetical protein JWR37_244, partial [Mycobacterium sp.]|nr:hypothetical protein [Mycobacterium sp.]